MNKVEFAASFAVKDSVAILKRDGKGLRGYISKVDLAQDKMVLQVGVDIGFDGKVEREHLVDCRFSDIETITRLKNGVATGDPVRIDHASGRDLLDKAAMVRSFVEKDAVTVVMRDGTTFDGYLSKIDLGQDKLVLQVGVDVGLNGKVEREHLIDCRFDDIDAISHFRHGAPIDDHPAQFDSELRRYPVGVYLMIWGKLGASLSLEIEQGVLKSIDWGRRKLVLHNITNNEDRVVLIDRITSIDARRAGPGAIDSAQTAKWVRKMEGNFHYWYRDGEKYAGD